MPKLQAFSERTKNFLTECIDPDGKKFIKDLIKRLFILIRVQTNGIDESEEIKSDDSSDIRKAIVAHVGLEE